MGSLPDKKKSVPMFARHTTERHNLSLDLAEAERRLAAMRRIKIALDEQLPRMIDRWAEIVAAISRLDEEYAAWERGDSDYWTG